MKLEIGKEYVTRSGLKVKIYDISESKIPNYPVVAGAYRDGEIIPVSYAINGTYVINREGGYDIVGEWQEPLDFDWSCLPPWINEYVAMDGDGTWYAYSMEPQKLTKFLAWRNTGELGQEAIIIPEEYAPKNFTGTWENSLFKNPNK